VNRTARRAALAGALLWTMSAAAFGAEAPAPAVPPVTLTLAQCVQLGLDHATEVLKARHATQTSGVALLQSYAQFLPSVETDDQYSRTWGNELLTIGVPTVERTDNHGPTLNLAASLNIFNGFADVGAFRSAVRRDKAAKLSLERARQDVALDIAQTYLQIDLDEEFARIDAASLRVSSERQDQLAEQARVGARTYVDLYQQEAQTSAAESALIAAKTKARDDLLLLLQKIRVDLRQDYEIAPVALDTAPIRALGDEPALISYALSRRPDLSAARAVWRAAQSDATVARRGYYPTLDLGFGASSAARRFRREIIDGVDELPASQDGLGAQLSNHINYTVAANLRWLLFDRLVTKLGAARSDQAERDARVDAEDAGLKVARDVRQAYGDYLAAVEQLRAARTGVVASGKAYEAMKARYEVGSSSFLDLITAQNVDVQSQAAAAQANVGLILQERVVQYALGELPGGGE
jgi:outer membrane protein